MTNDNFTDAARAEAERRFDFLSDASCFEQGAEWARTHLAAQEPTGAECLAVQKCLYERTLTWVPTVEVRAALSAARAARREKEER